MKRIITITAFTLLISFVPRNVFSQDWEKIYTGYNYIFRGIEFPGNQSQTGFAGGQSVTYYGNGIVIKTTDGGNSWSSLWTGTQLGVEGISFPTLNTGYICGWTQMIKKTINGGLTWNDLTPTAPANVYYYTDIIFKDSLHGIVVAGLNGAFAAGVFATSDGGITWTSGTGMANEVPYKITYVSDNTYFYVTNNGKIQKTTDGGLTWSLVASGMGLLLGIDFYNPMIGIATTEEGLFYKTFDGGITWQPQVTAFGNPLWRSTDWKNQNEIIMCGTPETIWKSIDGGVSWNDDYPASAYNGAMYEMLYTQDDFWYACGSQGYFYRKAPLLVADFTASATTVCNGTSVQFTDQSLGSPTSWNWIFEGGTPSTSTLQNPTVTYATPGTYDVSLTVTKLSTTNSLINPDYITVEGTLAGAPSQPTGPTSICGTFSYGYSTTSVPLATSYTWIVEPSTAGTIFGTGLTSTLNASNNAGIFSVKVAGNNSCGIGPYSSLLNGTLNFQPNVYSLLTGGGYCNGDPGFEIWLENSDPGVDYQLYKDGTASGAPVAGTGNTLSFGYQTTGSYTVSASASSCSANMQGIAYVYMVDPPAAAVQPTGPTSVCEGSSSTYTASSPANSTQLVWSIDPSSAGTITQPTTTTATINWNPGFSGNVAISFQGQNECGTGTASPPLSVMVNLLPTPEISGMASVCKNQEIIYNTTANAGSTFTWSVTGGSIVNGQGSNEITVLWTSLGTGSVGVTELSAENCTGNSPIFPVEVNECTGIIEHSSRELTLYPNPVNDLLNITAFPKENESYILSIYDHLGQVVFRSDGQSSQDHETIQVELRHLSAGTYLARISSGNKAASQIFIKR